MTTLLHDNPCYYVEGPCTDPALLSPTMCTKDLTHIVILVLCVQYTVHHTLYYHAQVGLDDGPRPQVLHHGQQQSPVQATSNGKNRLSPVITYIGLGSFRNS